MSSNSRTKVVLLCPHCHKTFERFFEQAQKIDTPKEVQLSCDNCGKESLFAILYAVEGTVIYRGTKLT